MVRRAHRKECGFAGPKAYIRTRSKDFERTPKILGCMKPSSAPLFTKQAFIELKTKIQKNMVHV